jgi:hypothetical protein
LDGFLMNKGFPFFCFLFFGFFSFLMCTNMLAYLPKIPYFVPTYLLLTHMAGPPTYMAIPPTHLPTIISSGLVMNQTYQRKKTPSHHPNM